MDYQDFLKSEEWGQLRDAALARAGYLCEYCKDVAEHVHHLRYPKIGQNHSLDMLVAVCARCHDISHGAKDMESLLNPKTTNLVGPYDNSVSVFHANGLVWASVDQWVRVLQAPYFMPDYLRTHADVQSNLLKGGQYSATCGGTKVYRWPPIAAAIDNWHRSWMLKVTQQQHTTMPLNQRQESERFARNVMQLKAWGWELQERELQAAMNNSMTREQSDSGVAETKQAMKAIQHLAQATQVVLEDHDRVLDRHDEELQKLKSDIPIYRDPDEYVSIKQRCLELSLPFGIVVQGKMNLTQACGQFLKGSGAEQGSNQVERLDGQSLTMPVSTWKRKDIDGAISRFMPKPSDPAQMDLL